MSRKKLSNGRTGPITSVFGLQHGDEGKAKIVDWLLSYMKKKGKPFTGVARYQGGPNAGHTIWIDGVKYVTHQNPSGMFVPGTELITGSDVVFCPLQFMKEYDELKAQGIDILKLTRISSIAPIRTPWHIQLDHADEHKRSKGGKAIGTTKQGISWVYQDVAGRRQLTVAGLLSRNWKKILAEKVAYWEQQLFLYARFHGYSSKSTLTNQQIEEWKDAVQRFRKLFKDQVVSMPYYMNSILQNGGTVLAEGAQGFMLDVNYGAQPNVTSSHPGLVGISASLGVAPDALGDSYGVFKAYNTKVGSGPFTSKITDLAISQAIAEKGHEKGATTGRLRDIGWLDLVELRYAIMCNNPNKLVMTKADVLESVQHVGIVSRYQGFDHNLHDLDFKKSYEPHITANSIWENSIAGVKYRTDLSNYFRMWTMSINKHLNSISPGLEISHVGTGCDRNEIVSLL